MDPFCILGFMTHVGVDPCFWESPVEKSEQGWVEDVCAIPLRWLDQNPSPKLLRLLCFVPCVRLKMSSPTSAE